MFYGMPLTDPRYLEADEETVLRDLLLIRSYQAELNPGRAQAEGMANEPGIEARMEARKKAAMAEPAMIAALAAVGVKIGPSKPPPKPKTITFRRKSGAPPVKP